MPTRINARHHHPARQLLAARRAPLILSCLQSLFEQSQDGVGFDAGLRSLAEMLADHANAGEFEIGEEDFAAQARKELRSWIKLSLVVEREGRVYATDAFEEALPEKLQRFLHYLNQSSDQGVAQLLSAIENEVSMIEERIEDLNRPLPATVPQRVVHENLRTLQQAQRHLRSTEVKDDQGKSHFRALRGIVSILRDASDRKKTLSARALLDPRYRLTFAVSVIERESGAVKEVRTGSQGGSGAVGRVQACRGPTGEAIRPVWGIVFRQWGAFAPGRPDDCRGAAGDEPQMSSSLSACPQPT